MRKNPCSGMRVRFLRCPLTKSSWKIQFPLRASAISVCQILGLSRERSQPRMTVWPVMTGDSWRQAAMTRAESSAVNTRGSPSGYVPPRSRRWTSSTPWRRACLKCWSAADKERSGPSVPRGLAAGRVPDQRSSPLVATVQGLSPGQRWRGQSAQQKRDREALNDLAHD